MGIEEITVLSIQGLFEQGSRFERCKLLIVQPLPTQDYVILPHLSYKRGQFATDICSSQVTFLLI